MPRLPRLRVADIPLHVIQRGHNRRECFFEASDRTVYLALLRELSARFACAVHAYVLMTNHVHLLISASDSEAISLLMKHLGQRYVQYVNRKYERKGTLWEGRFRSHPVECERYLLACYRYIELNPVRARLVHCPADYLWSSYRANAGLKRSALVVPHEEYLAIGPTQYRLTFPAEVDRRVLDEIRSAATGSLVLGRPEFRARIAATTGARIERRTPGRPPRENRGLSRISENRGLSRFLDVK